jgi:ATP phosphoribosyltransferase
MEGWCAVSSLVNKSGSAEVMDQLTAIGATDILLFEICNSRM